MKVWSLPVWLVRGVVRVVVAVLVAASAAPLQHTFDPHDADCCDAVAVVHDATQHRFEAAVRQSADEAGDHCAACHAARTFSSKRRAASGRPVLGVGVQLAHSPMSAPRPQLDLRLPARAPPSLG